MHDLRVFGIQNRVDLIESKRTGSAIVLSLITAIQERCRIARSPDEMSDNQLLAYAKKGGYINWLPFPPPLYRRITANMFSYPGCHVAAIIPFPMMLLADVSMFISIA